MTAEERAFVTGIGALLEEHVRPVLPPLGRWKITLVCRIPDLPEADLLIGSDDLDSLAALLERCKARPEIPGEVLI